MKDHAGNQRLLFTASKKLLGTAKESTFPPHSDKHTLANEMGSFFVKKIHDIRTEINSETPNPDYACDTVQQTYLLNPSLFSEFETVSNEDVRKLIMNAAAKSCSRPRPNICC